MEYNYLDCLAELGVGGAHPGGLQLTKEILSDEEIDGTMSILDAGCGTGQTSAYIAQQYHCQVTALDYNQTMLDKAKSRFLTLKLPIEVKHGCVENLANDRLFDMVLSESVIAFTDASLTIAAMKNALKPDGVLLAIEMVLEEPHPEANLQPIYEFYGVSHIRSEAEWISLIKKQGFNQILVKEFKLTDNIVDVEHASDFSLSENIDEAFFDMLHEHDYLTKVYRDILGFRLFRCTVDKGVKRDDY